jgi:hypothetical protein
MNLRNLSKEAKMVLLLNTDHSWDLLPGSAVGTRQINEAQVVVAWSSDELSVVKNRFGPHSN